MQVMVAVDGLRTAFRERQSEWAFASMLLLWGAVLLAPTDIFDGRAYMGLRQIMSEDRWGVLMLIGGALRLLILAGNGAWRPLYYFRAWMSGTTAVVWMMIGLGFWWSGSMGTWLAIYPVLILFEMLNVFRAAADAAAVSLAAKARKGIGIAQPPDPA